MTWAKEVNDFLFFTFRDKNKLPHLAIWLQVYRCLEKLHPYIEIPIGTARIDQARAKDAVEFNARVKEHYANIEKAVEVLFILFLNSLPPVCYTNEPIPEDQPHSFNISFLDVIDRNTITTILYCLVRDDFPSWCYKSLDKTITRNLEETGLPDKFKGTNRDMVRAYFANTPFLELFDAQIPFTIPTSSFKEHGFLFAKSGHGKSQTMRAFLSKLIEEDCALFLIDGNGGLIENVDKIAGIKDRLVVLDPRDAPALNFFHMTGGSREKQMELFFYLFKAIDQGLTQRQATMISYLIDLMQVIPGSNLNTLREVCEAKTFPAEYLPLLPPITQDFFRNQFFAKDALVTQTKSQIAQRLYTICRNQIFADMFNAPENRFNAFDCMQEKKVVVVDASRDTLGDGGSAIFQRYILAQCLAAAFQRPKDKRHLALIILDEAKTSLDDQSQKILSDARAFGLGLLLCSQFPDQLDDGVRKEVINNTTIKLAGPASFSVVAQLHRDMRCEADFILGMKKEDFSHTEWACYVDNLTPQAVKLTVPFGALEKLPQLSQAEHRALRARNKECYAPTNKPPTVDEGLRVNTAQPPRGDVPPSVPPATISPKVNKVELRRKKPKKPEQSDPTLPDPDY
jgi:hypothetical protein